MVKTKFKISTKEMIYCAIFTALVAVGAFIRVPIPVVPFTLQLFFTMLAGLFLGAKLGSFSVLMYVVLGLIGLPIFTQGGGLSYIFQPTFGYIIGFVVGTYATGKIAHKNKTPTVKRLLVANFTGLLIVYAFGMVYYWLITKFYLKSQVGLWSLFLYCFLMVVPGDAVLCVLAAFLSKRLIPLINKNNKEV